MHIKVAQWNVWVRGNPDAAAETVRKVNADIWCMQELTRNSTVHPGVNLDDLLREQGYHALFVPTRTETGELAYEMGNAIFSRWPLTHRRTVRLQTEDPESSMYAKVENRVALVATAHTPAGDITVVSAHLSWQNELLTAEVPRFVDVLQEEATPLIVGADLNIQADTSYVAELNEAFMSLGPPITEATWPMMRVSFDSGRTFVEPLTRRYDYMFGSSDVRQVRGLVIADESISLASDHAIAIAELEIFPNS